MARLLRIAALLASLVILLGLAMFVSDEASKGSRTQVQALGSELNDPAPDASGEAARERAHGALRERVDDANDVLLAPFTGLTGSHDAWVRRLVPTALALLVYGLGLTLLANFMPGPRREVRDWRSA